MQIILLERIEKLGQMGDVVRVKDGYARNYLLPQKKAMRATEVNRKSFDSRRVELEAHNLERRDEASTVAEKMEGAKVVLVRQASVMGQLYGSVSARDVAESLSEAGYQVERRQVVMDRPIKALGIHSIRITLHPEVSVTVGVNVARTRAEAELQEAGQFFDDASMAPELETVTSEVETPETDEVPETGTVETADEGADESDRLS